MECIVYGRQSLAQSELCGVFVQYIISQESGLVGMDKKVTQNIYRGCCCHAIQKPCQSRFRMMIFVFLFIITLIVLVSSL
jgi:hypothetical protein